MVDHSYAEHCALGCVQCDDRGRSNERCLTGAAARLCLFHDAQRKRMHVVLKAVKFSVNAAKHAKQNRNAL